VQWVTNSKGDICNLTNLDIIFYTWWWLPLSIFIINGTKQRGSMEIYSRYCQIMNMENIYCIYYIPRVMYIT
jgi:hypothetical protein